LEGAMRLLNISPRQLENYLINLDQRYRGEPIIPVASDEDEDNEDYTYICTIGLTPLEDPVQDPTTGTKLVLYERKAIVQWLRTNSISPYNRCPLRVSALLEIDQMSPETRAGVREQQERIRNREIA